MARVQQYVHTTDDRQTHVTPQGARTSGRVRCDPTVGLATAGAQVSTRSERVPTRYTPLPTQPTHSVVIVKLKVP